MAYDCSHIHERLYVGSNIASTDDIDDVGELGITHIINARRAGDTLKFANRSGLGLAVIHLPTEDDGQYKHAEWFGSAINFALGAMAHPRQRVLVHCMNGVNRAPSLAYAILRAQGWPADESLERIRRRRMQTIGGITYADDAERALAQLGWIRSKDTSR